VSPVSAACPSCGAPVEFRHDDTFVRVCSYCNAVVARADRGFQSLGRMGDLAASESPLALNAVGRVGEVRFELVGRAQIQHPRGGGWEEWYARFDNGTWGWLSEAQGRFQLSFPAPLPPHLRFGLLVPGQAIELALPGRPSERFTVSEVGAAAYRAAAGELPYALTPGQRFRFADLSGDRGGFATVDAGVDEGDPLALYIGQEISLADLHIAGGAAEVRAAPVVSAHHVACPQCAGSLELRAPDACQRVVCPYCAAVLDSSQGHLSYLRTLDRDTELLQPEIPLGTTAELDGHALTVIGCLRRSVRVDDIDYPFTEYLLYQPAAGYRWLVESAGHWSYVTPLAAGAVREDQIAGFVQHDRRRFRHFQTASARVDRIFGEFTWKVELGERATMTDFVRPPYMMSSEQDQSEINWSLGVWMDPAELGRRLRPPGGEPGSITLARPSSVAPHQPFRHKGILKLTAVMIGLLLAAAIGVNACSRERTIPLTFEPPLDAVPLEAPPAPRVHFSQSFELEARRNIELELTAPIDNSWLYVEADLIDEKTGEVEGFDVALEYYHGYEDGESWTEGSRTRVVHLGAHPAGQYLLRLETQHPDKASTTLGALGLDSSPAPPPALQITMRQGVFRSMYLVIALGMLMAIPLLIGVSWFLFEKRRWSESDHPWFQGSDE
jgi:hypothetical protein